MVRRPNKTNKQTSKQVSMENASHDINKPKIQTSIKGMENNFHDVNQYHSFVTKLMFLTDQVTIDTTANSNNNEANNIDNKMIDKEWCATEHGTMPKQLLNYSYIITNEVDDKIRFSLKQSYLKQEQLILYIIS